MYAFAALWESGVNVRPFRDRFSTGRVGGERQFRARRQKKPNQLNTKDTKDTKETRAR